MSWVKSESEPSISSLWDEGERLYALTTYLSVWDHVLTYLLIR